MQKVTIKTIAKELGISVSTVSRALQNNTRIGEKTRKEVNSMAEKLQYVPNPIALNLQRSRTNTLGLIVPTLSEEFFSHIVSGVEKVANEKGFHVIVNQSQDNMNTEKEIIQSYIAAKLDGIMVSIAADTSDYSHFVKVQKQSIPLVFYDRIPRNFPSHQIRSDIQLGISEAIRFLYEKNIRKIALLNGPSNLLVSDERLNGYLTAIKNLGLSTSPKYIKTTNLTRQDTFQKMTEFIELGTQRPEAVVCFNDYVALHAIRACQHHHLQPNKDVSFVSFANIGISEFIENKPIASVEQFPAQMGEESARLLLENILDKENPAYKKISVSTQLVVHPHIS
jgi:LacI family repressor for deo operon, udp, cdd, tsx, nupC, and nupG